MLTDVGVLEDFADGSIRVVLVRGLEIGIACWKGQFFAIRNQCPDQLGPLCEGGLRPMLTIDTGLDTIVVDEDVAVVACPWHFWEFDLKTGLGLRYGSRAKTYRTLVKNGRVFVEIGREATA